MLLVSLGSPVKFRVSEGLNNTWQPESLFVLFGSMRFTAVNLLSDTSLKLDKIKQEKKSKKK